MFFTGDSSTRKRVDLGGRSSKERDRQKLLEQTRLERNRRLSLRQQNFAALKIQVLFYFYIVLTSSWSWVLIMIRVAEFRRVCFVNWRTSSLIRPWVFVTFDVRNFIIVDRGVVCHACFACVVSCPRMAYNEETVNRVWSL